jgi:hypothetical protein
MMQDKDELIRQLLREGKTFAEICDIGNVSPNRVSRVSKEMEQEAANAKGGSGKSDEELAIKIFKMLKEGKTPLEIRISLKIDEATVTRYCQEYWRLQQLGDLASLPNRLGDRFDDFSSLGKLMIDENIDKGTIVAVIEYVKDIHRCQETLRQVREETSKAEARLAHVESNIRFKKNEMDDMNDDMAQMKQQINLLVRQKNELDKKCQDIRNEAQKLEARVEVLDRSYREIIELAGNYLSAVFSSKRLVVEATVKVTAVALKEDVVNVLVLKNPVQASWIAGRPINEQQAEKLAQQQAVDLVMMTWQRIIEDSIQHSIRRSMDNT